MNFLLSILFSKLLLSAGTPDAYSDEGATVWTGTLEGKEGIFAYRLDEASGNIVVFRCDGRGPAPERLRARISRGEGQPLLVELRRLESAVEPWRYSASVPTAVGQTRGLELEKSAGGGSWIPLGRVLRGAP